MKYDALKELVMQNSYITLTLIPIRLHSTHPDIYTTKVTSEIQTDTNSFMNTKTMFVRIMYDLRATHIILRRHGVSMILWQFKEIY